MRPHSNIWKLVSHARAIYIAINLFILEDLAYLIACRMVVLERLNVIDIVGKDDVFLALVKLQN